MNQPSRRRIWAGFGDFIRKHLKKSTPGNEGLASPAFDDLIHCPQPLWAVNKVAEVD
jgi:hypothetical protein